VGDDEGEGGLPDPAHPLEAAADGGPAGVAAGQLVEQRGHIVIAPDEDAGQRRQLMAREGREGLRRSGGHLGNAGRCAGGGLPRVAQGRPDLREQ
jgi:hypothetical protein